MPDASGEDRFSVQVRFRPLAAPRYSPGVFAATHSGDVVGRRASGPLFAPRACGVEAFQQQLPDTPGAGLSLDCGLFSDCDDLDPATATEWTNTGSLPGGGGTGGVVVYTDQVNDPVFGNLTMDGLADEETASRRVMWAEWDAGLLTHQNWCFSVYLARPAVNSPGGAPPSTEAGLEMENWGASNNFSTLRVFIAADGTMTSSLITGSQGAPDGGMLYEGLLDLGPGLYHVYRPYVTTTPTLGLPIFHSILWPQKTTTPAQGWIYAWGAQMVEGTVPLGPERGSSTPGELVTLERPLPCAMHARRTRGVALARAHGGETIGVRA